MRSLLFWLTVLSASACTRANPGAFHLGTPDLSTPPLGGGGGGRDLATTGSPDLAGAGESIDLAEPPRDLAFGPGVVCGATVCTAPDSACCVNSGSERCTQPTPQACGNGGNLIACDGPEDCTNFGSNVCCGNGGGGDTVTQCRFSCQGGEVPMCHHQASECPPLAGWVACCPRAGTPFARCSKSACP